MKFLIQPSRQATIKNNSNNDSFSCFLRVDYLPDTFLGEVMYYHDNTTREGPLSSLPLLSHGKGNRCTRKL